MWGARVHYYLVRRPIRRHRSQTAPSGDRRVSTVYIDGCVVSPNCRTSAGLATVPTTCGKGDITGYSGFGISQGKIMLPLCMGCRGKKVSPQCSSAHPIKSRHTVPPLAPRGKGIHKGCRLSRSRRAQRYVRTCPASLARTASGPGPRSSYVRGVLSSLC